MRVLFCLCVFRDTLTIAAAKEQPRCTICVSIFYVTSRDSNGIFPTVLSQPQAYPRPPTPHMQNRNAVTLTVLIPTFSMRIPMYFSRTPNLPPSQRHNHRHTSQHPDSSRTDTATAAPGPPPRASCSDAPYPRPSYAGMAVPGRPQPRVDLPGAGCVAAHGARRAGPRQAALPCRRRPRRSYIRRSPSSRARSSAVAGSVMERRSRTRR